MTTSVDSLPYEPKHDLDEDIAVQKILQECTDTSQQPQQQQQQQPQFDQQYTENTQPTYATQYEEYEMTEPNLSLFQRILKEAKIPLIVASLFILFNLPLIDKLLAQNLPRIANEAGGMNIFGIVIKAMVLTLTFYLINKLVL